ncbi:hypothetical protein [Thermomonospora cellulosilytica]|uniref:Uncharacterized protein n=1 Tax=Thermomonospora cellulosilytica TaxID=1411118 RepID=A0A7W3RA06_9ACTN|nr:hypothetical protein [Thermomonospora cellulosilytica]MBA9005908.1 hypothetical protein [Thermomonospora cellulosilytica]
MQTTVYYRNPDGSVGQVTVERPDWTGEPPGDEPPYQLPPGAVEITREEYEQTLADIQAAIEEQRRQVAEAEAARAKADYEALRAAGIPEEIARRLSGYTPPDPESQDAAGQGR